MGRVAGERERVTGIVGFAMGATTGTVWMVIDGFDPDGSRAPSWVALLIVGAVLSRRKREHDQLIFRKASLFAFFATVFAAIVYGTLAEVTDVPDLSFAALAIFGMGAWIVFLFVFDRRYS